MLYSGMKYKTADKIELSHIPITEKEYILFSNFIAENTGIVIPYEKAYIFETRLAKFLVDAEVDSLDELYRYLIKSKDPLFRQKIINSITTNETKWFRDEAPWKVLEEKLLPGLVDDLMSGKKTKVRIWSAAASTGQEIYSTVMCVDNYLRINNIKDISLNDFEFFATDISSQILDIAKKGRYDRISIMRGLNDHYKKNYFTSSGSVWYIDPKIFNAVKFEHFNLMNSYQSFGLFDIILCRYVLIYFSDALKSEIAAKMYDSLLDKGVLFTGNYAIYELFRDNFDADYYGNLTYYIKKKR